MLYIQICHDYDFVFGDIYKYNFRICVYDRSNIYNPVFLNLKLYSIVKVYIIFIFKTVWVPIHRFRQYHRCWCPKMYRCIGTFSESNTYLKYFSKNKSQYSIIDVLYILRYKGYYLTLTNYEFWKTKHNTVFLMFCIF